MRHAVRIVERWSGGGVRVVGWKGGRGEGGHTDVSCAAAAVDYVGVVGGCMTHFCGVVVSFGVVEVVWVDERLIDSRVKKVEVDIDADVKREMCVLSRRR